MRSGSATGGGAMDGRRPSSFSGALFLAALLHLGACAKQEPSSRCVDCHSGLEPVSATHTDCLACHGGDGGARQKDRAHEGMHGHKNPSAPIVWQKTCGACHPLQLKRVRSALMTTNTGMIRNIQATWEGEDGLTYAAQPAETFDAEGRPLSLAGVAELQGLSGELYRKFCSLCHVGLQSDEVYAGSHAAGCAACHFPYNETATYEGADKTVRDRWPLSATHAMVRLPDNRVCARCHNRSGRIALSYQGRNDGNNGLVPTRNGEPGPEIISGARNATAIAPDIHFEKGMDCIDCHTSRDVMGDGYAYQNLYAQVEVACEDCHGSPTERPRAATITRENDEAVRESASYRAPARSGMEMLLTAKGRKYSNAWLEAGTVIVQSKRSGKRHESKVITATPEHAIVGHERMECHACHSRTVVQCYGCHTTYDRTKVSRDFIRGADTPGEFSETEDYRTLYPFPLALNQRGRISAVTPGCQTFVTEIGARGEPIREEYVSQFKGRRQLRFAPFFSHNTGPKAIGCTECHANPAFLGFGQHVVEGTSIQGTLLCERSDEKPLDGYLTLKDGRVRAFAAITRENSRPLDGPEVRRVWSVNQCLACHDDAKDPIYRKKLDYARLERCLGRPRAP